jgi:hypothetical protein
MTGQEMLNKLGIDQEQVDDYKKRLSDFNSSLPAPLASVQARTQNTVPLDQVKNWFGPNVTQDDLNELLKAAPWLDGVIAFTNVGKPPL